MVTTEELEKLQKQVHDTQELLAKQAEDRGHKDGIVNFDSIKRDEFEKMKVDVIEEMKSVKKEIKESRFNPSQLAQEKREKNSLMKYLLRVKYPDAEMQQAIAKTVMSEGTPAQGGYSVPQEWADFVAGELNDPASILSKVTMFPHGQGYIKNIPKWLTDLTVYWVAEATAKTPSKPTLTTKTSTLAKLCAIITATDEFLQDNSVQMDTLLGKLVAENFAAELERVILVGDVAGLTDPFNGIYYSTPATVPQGGANLTYQDIVNIWANPNVLMNYRVGAEWYFNTSVLALIMALVDGNGRPLWNNQNALDAPFGSMFASKINISDQITNILGTGLALSTIIYGNYKNVFMGYKTGNEQISVSVTNQAIISTSTSVTENLWQQDETGFRFVFRRSIVVVNPTAFSVGTNIQ